MIQRRGDSSSGDSPWLRGVQPPTINTASFVEYLRWLRQKTGNDTTDSNTVIELYSKFEASDYSTALTRMTSRTKKLSHWFTSVKCPWRIRVGGAKGPESMLLPAFDSQGLPYIPSSTLRGIARAVAMRDKNYRDQVDTIFGNVDPKHTCMGQVTFLDAYPLPGKDKKGGLKPDMANAIWTWKNNQDLPGYAPNPNNFLSLSEPTFVIGLRKDHCTDEIFELVKRWLMNGLAQGIGSQVNTGYGALDPIEHGQKVSRQATILKVSFELSGQLIHGGQKFNSGFRPKAEPEIRPVAFRGMLRYWFRALASGYFKSDQVREFEKELFGGIEPQPAKTGLFRLEISDAKLIDDNTSKKNAGFMEATLTLRASIRAHTLAPEKQNALVEILRSLTWLMFHLGGVGQGARRPCYSRANRPKPPWYRGSTLEPHYEEGDKFWGIPQSVTEFKMIFCNHLKKVHASLSQLFDLQTDIAKVRKVSEPNRENWQEIIDGFCKIVVCGGKSDFEKPFALAQLHSDSLKANNGYDRNLCGSVHGIVKPSPVWIADLGDYQVVTIFGATVEPRNKYLKQLEENAEKFDQIWPMS
jgi:CRISPR-associated protein Cmr6